MRSPSVWRAAPVRWAQMLFGTLGVIAASAVLASPAAAAISFSAPDSVSEGSAVQVKVWRPAGASAATALDVTVQAKAGTATAKDDFDDAAKTITLKANELSREIVVATVEDTLDEDPETFKISVETGLAGDPADQKVTINDDDNPPTVALAGNVSAAEGTSDAKTPFNFELKLSKASGKKITVSYYVWDNSAIEPGDFTDGEGKIVIPPGSTTATLPVPVVADNVDEKDEKFEVELEDVENATLGQKTAWGTITNDDLPTVSIEDAKAKRNGSGPTAIDFTVRLSNPSSAPQITVNYEVTPAPGAAAAPAGIAQRTGTVTFSPGETSDTIRFWFPNGTPPAGERFTVTLNSPNGAAMGRTQATGIVENEGAAPAAVQPVFAPAAPAPATIKPAATQSGPTATVARAARLALTAPFFTRARRVRTTVTCPASAGSCQGSVTIFTVPSRRSKIRDLRRELKVASTRFRLPAGQRITVTMRPSARVLALLRKVKTLRVKSYVVVTDSRGRVQTRQLASTLRRR